MYILSPKTTFLGGSLVSAYHLGKLFPGKLITFEYKSQFLDCNKVSYECTHVGDLNNKFFRLHETEKSIWCNDTCTDLGYKDDDKDNAKLWEFLGEFDTVYLVNHQPINRYKSYLTSMFKYLESTGTRIILFNYRACWTTEWNHEMKYLFPKVDVYQLPYFYYLFNQYQLGDLNELVPDSFKSPKVLMIGRDNSKCKITSKYEKIKQYLGDLDVTMILPDRTKSNKAFMEDISKFPYVLTGYYYGGEGNRELDEAYNHLEWSFIDVLFSGCIPLTSSLFSTELKRLGIPAPVLDYEFRDLPNIREILFKSDLNYTDVWFYAVKSLIEEIKTGNQQLEMIMKSGNL